MLLAAGVVGLVVLQVPLCPFALFTHQPCPACGMTRATVALMQLDPQRAFAFHPLVFVAAPLFGFAALFAAKTYVREGHVGLPRPLAKLFGPAVFVLVLVMVVVWIARFQGAFGGPVSV